LYFVVGGLVSFPVIVATPPLDKTAPPTTLYRILLD
jgi:hypothetical protein